MRTIVECKKRPLPCDGSKSFTKGEIYEGKM